LPGGPVGPPARWAAKSNVVGCSGTEGGRCPQIERELAFDKLFAEAPEFLVTPLFNGAGLPK